MIRRHATALRLTLAAVDFLAAVAVFIGVSVVRFGPSWRADWEAAAGNPWLLATAYGAGWVAILWLLGLYRLRARWSWRAEWTDLLRAVLLIAFLTFAVLFAVKLPDVSRLFLLGLFAAQAVVAITSRGLLRLLLARARERGRNTRFVLVVGDGPAARDFGRMLERNAYLGLRVAGFLADPGPEDPHPGSTPVGSGLPTAGTPPPIGALGRIDQIEAVLRSTVIDEVAICLPPEHGAFVEPVARLCEEEGLVVRVPLVDGATAIPGGRVEDFEGIRLQSLVYGPDRTVGLIAKRLIDIMGAAVLLVLVAPLLAGVALFVIARDGRPVLFRQVRVGMRGRPFVINKLRTMYRDAEDRYDEVAALSDTSGAAFKMTDDPRITPWGRILRKTSIDELPQFLNVLRGEMSLVGPRPAPPREVDEYDVWHRRRLSVKPGVTGLWQVEARRDEDFDRRARLDLDYIDRWSLWLDLKIIVRTVPAMLQGR
jgi:exopolysaccharide biosynthesis polyprenyl glycosylphosphotransferase